MAGDANTPISTSSDYDEMLPQWDQVETILGGAAAIKAAGTTYLPKFDGEEDGDYQERLDYSKFSNIYGDIVENLTAKPMAKEVGLVDGTASPELEAIAEDVDGAGNNLHVYATSTLYRGINYGVDWIFVDYPKVDRTLTRAQERAAGVRPYWVAVPAKRMLAVYSAMIDGHEQFTHARILETTKRRTGFSETVVTRVRVLDRQYIETEDPVTGLPVVSWGPPTFTLYELQESRVNGQQKEEWHVVDEGMLSIGFIPLVPFIAGRRRDRSWRISLPMQAAADLQIQHYRAESNLNWTKVLTAFPMMSAKGVKPQTTEQTDTKGNKTLVPVRMKLGPRVVLYGPPDANGTPGEWSWVEPSAESLKFLAQDVENTEMQLRELGRQPLTARTGNLTVVTTAFAADKANSVAQAWALNLKDALELAWSYTAQWMRDGSEPEVALDVDFDIGLEESKGPLYVLQMRASGDISQRTLWEEQQRYGVLSADFDPDVEEKLLLEENPQPTEADLLASGGAGSDQSGQQPGDQQPGDQQQ